MAHLTDQKRLVDNSVRAPNRRRTILGSALGVGVAVVLLAALTGLLGWRPDEMRALTICMGALLALLAVVSFYEQGRQQTSTYETLRSMQARISGVVESAMDAIITVDENQRIVLFNAAAESVFRWPRNATLGQPLDMLIPERLRARHRDHIERFAATGITSRRMGDKTVLLGLRANGEEFPLEASISQHSEDGRKFFTVIVRDITERTRAGELLARSEERLRGILDSAMDAIITVDESEHIVIFNKAAETVFGCPRNEALGAPLTSFIPARFRANHSAYIKSFGEAGAGSRRMGEQRIVTGLRRSGEEFPIEASISQTSEHGSRLFTVILRDVSQRVQSEIALRQSREELRELGAAAHSVREQEKSRMARELHDELAQSLTFLKLDLAGVRRELPSAQAHLAAKLDTCATALDDMVAATRRIAADLRPLMLDDLGLVPAAEWLVQNFMRRHGIECEFSVDPPELELQEPHATAFFRILQESLVNVARHANASLVHVTLDGSDGEVVLRVRDNGRGFDAGGPRERGSLGLIGLRERASLLGGEIIIESAPGQGTVIEVRVPWPEAA